MHVNYTQNGNCYVLANFAASNNPIFMNDIEVNNFKQRVDTHISTLCEILGYYFTSDHYQIIVSLKDRQTFIDFYRKKMENPDLEEIDIPPSTYILSQEMANIQSGYAKWFNFRHVRFGSVFGRRYTKVLISSEEELKEWVNSVNNKKPMWSFGAFWSYTKNFVQRIKKLKKVDVSSAILYESGIIDAIISSFILLEKFLERGPYLPNLEKITITFSKR